MNPYTCIFNFVSTLNSSLFTLRLHHGGKFENMHHLEYIGGNTKYFWDVDSDKLSTLELKDMAESKGCFGVNRLAYRHLNCVCNHDN